MATGTNGRDASMNLEGSPGKTSISTGIPCDAANRFRSYLIPARAKSVNSATPTSSDLLVLRFEKSIRIFQLQDSTLSATLFANHPVKKICEVNKKALLLWRYPRVI